MAPQIDQNIDHFKIIVPIYIYSDSLYLFTDIDNKICIKVTIAFCGLWR